MNVAVDVKKWWPGRAAGDSQEASTMYPRQMENMATQHVQEMRSRRRPGPGPRQARGIRRQAGWTLVAVGLRLASSASR